MQEEILSQKIIGCAMRVHSSLGPGFLESVYQRALVHELGKSGLQLEAQKPVPVYYDGILVGDFIADILVESKIMLELKAIQSIQPAHEAQLVNYLVATGIDVGLLFNFGVQRLEFKRKARFLRPPARDDRTGLRQDEQNKDGNF